MKEETVICYYCHKEVSKNDADLVGETVDQATGEDVEMWWCGCEDPALEDEKQHPNKTKLDELIAEGKARNWQDEPGTMVSIAQIEILQQLEEIRDRLFRMGEYEKDEPNKKRLSATYSHISAAVKRLKGL